MTDGRGFPAGKNLANNINSTSFPINYSVLSNYSTLRKPSYWGKIAWPIYATKEYGGGEVEVYLRLFLT
jgi:hypothetical protein